MPVKKTNGNGVDRTKTPPMSVPEMGHQEMMGHPHFHPHHHLHCGSFHKKLFTTFVGILLVYLIVFLGVLIRNEIKKYDYIGIDDKSERAITVDAMGKVTAKPDIAMTTMGVTTKAKTVADAQAENTRIMNELILKLKGLGITEDDIQTTNYNIYPTYNWTELSGQVLDGYEISQNVSVKIRDLEKANQVIVLAGEVGATNVSGLNFTVDDKENYLKQAREEAFEKVVEKIKILSSSLGVKVLGIVSYNEYEGGTDGMYKGYPMMLDLGLGGGEGSPDIQAGSQELILNVSVTFEIR